MQYKKLGCFGFSLLGLKGFVVVYLCSSKSAPVVALVRDYT
jgi:hypothetical protein